MIYKSLTFRLYPTEDQVLRVEKALLLHCELYNAALEERKTAWNRCKESVTYFQQCAQMPHVWPARPDFKESVSAASAIGTLKRLDNAFRHFFRRVKLGQKAGFPRFKSVKRFVSISLSGCPNFKLTKTSIRLPKIGTIRWVPYCEFPGKAKSATIKRLADGYYATVVFECEDPIPLPKTEQTVGIDLGMRAVVSTSNGETVAARKFIQKAARNLRRLQQTVSRRKKGSRRHLKAVNLCARAYLKITRSKKHFLHNISKDLVNRYDVIGIEDISPQKMKRLGGGGARGRGFRRSFADVAWGELLRQISYKAAWADKRVIKVNARGTSQECSECGETVRKPLSERTHRCTSCNLVLDRDINAARNIHQRALQVLRGEAAPSGSSMKRESAAMDGSQASAN